MRIGRWCSPLTIDHPQLDVDAVRIARLRELFLDLRRVVLVLHDGLVVAHGGRREERVVEGDAQAEAHRLGHTDPIDTVQHSLTQIDVVERRRRGVEPELEVTVRVPGQLVDRQVGVSLDGGDVLGRDRLQEMHPAGAQVLQPHRRIGLKAADEGIEIR